MPTSEGMRAGLHLKANMWMNNIILLPMAEHGSDLSLLKTSCALYKSIIHENTGFSIKTVCLRDEVSKVGVDTGPVGIYTYI